MNSNTCQGNGVRKDVCHNLVQKPTTVLCSFCWNQFNESHE